MFLLLLLLWWIQFGLIVNNAFLFTLTSLPHVLVLKMSPQNPSAIYPIGTFLFLASLPYRKCLYREFVVWHAFIAHVQINQWRQSDVSGSGSFSVPRCPKPQHQSSSRSCVDWCRQSVSLGEEGVGFVPPPQRIPWIFATPQAENCFGSIERNTESTGNYRP